MGAATRKGSSTNLGGNSGTATAANSDSEENSDPLSSRQQLMRRSPKPCQFNFLVQLGEWEEIFEERNCLLINYLSLQILR